MYSVMITGSDVYICKKHPNGVSVALMVVIDDFGSTEQKISMACEFINAMNDRRES